MSRLALFSKRSSHGGDSSGRALEELSGSSRSSASYTDNDEKSSSKKKAGKLQEAMKDKEMHEALDAAYQRRMNGFERQCLLSSNGDTNTSTDSSRGRDSLMKSTRSGRGRRLSSPNVTHRDWDEAAPSPLVVAVCNAASNRDVNGLENILERMDSGDYELLNAGGADGVPALVVAAGRGRLLAVRALLTGEHRRYVDLNVQTALDGRTALHQAVRHRNHDVVKFLLIQGAKTDVEDIQAWTPIAYAKSSDDSAMVALVRIGEIRLKLIEVSAQGDHHRVASLLKAGHSLLSDSPHRSGSSRGRSADDRGHFGGSPEMKFAEGLWQDALDNALLLAASTGSVRCVRLLVGRGAHLNAAGQTTGRSALHLAVRGGHFEATRYLLDHGADPQAIDFDGFSVRDEAFKSGDPAMSELFASSSGGYSDGFGRDDRQAPQRRGGSAPRAPEVMTRSGSNGNDAAGRVARTVTTTGQSSSTASSSTSSISPANSLIGKSPGQQSAKPWEDSLVITVRIPMDKLEIGDAMSRGAYGDVYRGWYRGDRVAIKKLHPSMSREMASIEAFFAEIKLMAVLEHPQIVRFVGVAWDALSEVCAVSELMQGGDLGVMLSDLKAAGAPRGFRRNPIKLKLAADVAHALTYLHSMAPAPVLHRDLKSRNILLTADRRSAKLTDFGTSRETSDATLTAGVGTSLWMAPEVIMGERYGVRADVFSLGVVLSELATHALPYAHVTEHGSGRPLSTAAVVHNVVSGTITLDFAEKDDQDARSDGRRSLSLAAAQEVVDTARACVRFDQADRPEALKVASVLRRILRTSTLSSEP